MKKIKKRPVAFKGNTSAVEDLPNPIVLYPGHYGTFLAFQKNVKSPPYFCACAYEAIENYIEMRIREPEQNSSDKTRMFLLSSAHFPLSIVESLMQKRLSPVEVITHLNFAKRLCHECNQKIPAYRYCVEMYGGIFKQNYGWYINKQGFEWSINTLSLNNLPDRCPQELLDEISIDTGNMNSGWFDVLQGSNEEDVEAIKQIRKQNRKVRNLIENEVRSKFGYKKVGEAWTSETTLYYLIKNMYSGYNILRHHRPKILEGLELDVFIEELNIGIEYQGIQHYKPIKHWGGRESFEKLQIRDRKKKELCKQNKIHLIYFEHDEDLTDELVEQKIGYLIPKKTVNVT